MIRTVITPEQQKISLHLPANFIGRQVEVIAFTIDDTVVANDKSLAYYASEKTLSKDWLTPEEDKAWLDL